MEHLTQVGRGPGMGVWSDLFQGVTPEFGQEQGRDHRHEEHPPEHREQDRQPTHAVEEWHQKWCRHRGDAAERGGCPST